MTNEQRVFVERAIDAVEHLGLAFVGARLRGVTHDDAMTRVRISQTAAILSDLRVMAIEHKAPTLEAKVRSTQMIVTEAQDALRK